MANILIVGCGYVGCELAASYLRKQDTVWALQRHPVSIVGVNNIVADAMKVDVIPEVDIIFFMVAPDKHDFVSYEQAYIGCLENILRCMGQKKTTRFIFVSSTAVYGQQSGEWVDENSETKPQDFSGKILLKAESIVKHHAANYAIVRFAGIYGPSRDRMPRLVNEQKIQALPKSLYTNRIHLDDCVGVLQFVASLDQSDIFLGVDSEPALYNDVLFWLGQILNKPIAMGTEIPHRLSLSQKRCSNAKIRQLGYDFIHANYQSGYLSVINKNKLI